LWSEGVEAVVLYVEHDDVSAALMQEIFAGQPAWRLLMAGSGPEALKLAQQQAYDAIKGIHFDGMQYRTDIGHRALSR
jgi:phosphoribosylamine-glycine ligase